MTFDPEEVRNTLRFHVGVVNDAIDAIEKAARKLDDHDPATAQGVLEHTAFMRASASQVRNAAGHISDSKGEVTG